MTSHHHAPFTDDRNIIEVHRTCRLTTLTPDRSPERKQKRKGASRRPCTARGPSDGSSGKRPNGPGKRKGTRATSKAQNATWDRLSEGLSAMYEDERARAVRVASVSRSPRTSTGATPRHQSRCHAACSAATQARIAAAAEYGRAVMGRVRAVAASRSNDAPAAAVIRTQNEHVSATVEFKMPMPANGQAVSARHPLILVPPTPRVCAATSVAEACHLEQSVTEATPATVPRTGALPLQRPSVRPLSAVPPATPTQLMAPIAAALSARQATLSPREVRPVSASATAVSARRPLSGASTARTLSSRRGMRGANAGLHSLVRPTLRPSTAMQNGAGAPHDLCRIFPDSAGLSDDAPTVVKPAVLGAIGAKDLARAKAELLATAADVVKQAAKTAAANIAKVKRPPAALKALFRDNTDLTWSASKGRTWKKYTAGQLSYQLELEGLKESKKKVHEYSVALAARKAVAAELKPKIAYGDVTPLNLAAERRAFLEAWAAYKAGTRKELPNNPQFKYADDEAAGRMMDEYGKPRCALLDQARRIMDLKQSRHGDEGQYEQRTWGEPVGIEEGVEMIQKYLVDHGIAEHVTIKWHDNLSTPSMTMSMSHRRAKGVLHLPRNPKNKHFRRQWLQAMLDHEIGTHFTCAINDAHTSEYLRGTFSKGGQGFGTQKRPVTQREALCTEEGLATLNTHMAANVKLLWGPALAYWTRWMGSQLGFSELFEALEPYVPEPPRRWVQCYRCKRGLTDTGEKRALAKDQCYLEGAWRLLEGRKHLDFKLLHSGRIALEEYNDSRSAWLRFTQSCVMGKTSIVTPHFLVDPAKYAERLEDIARENGVEARGEEFVQVKIRRADIM